MTGVRIFTYISGRHATATDRRHRSLLAISVGGLVASVAALMCLSLSGCQMFEGNHAGPGSTAKGSPDVDRSPHIGLYQHVAPDAPNLTLAGVFAEPEMRVRIAAAVTEALISSAPHGWAPKPSTVPLPSSSSSPRAAGTTGIPQANLGPAGPVIIEPIGGRGGQGGSRGAGVRVNGPVRVVYVAGDWVVTDAAGSSQRIAAEAIELGPEVTESRTDSPNRSQANYQVIFAGAAYPGRLRLLPRSDVAPTGANSGFDVIEQVPLETYLSGVVVKEMYANWPLEAFRVQAICARSYALHERVRAMMTGKTYDVEASQRDQAYAGATTNQRAIEAVESTRGLVLSYQSAVLRAYYSSSCGGRTGAARDTWPIGPGFEYNLAAPIQSYSREYLCDKSCPKFNWVVVRDRAELVKRIRAYGETTGMLVRKLEGIASLEVMRTAATGRPAEYKIVEPGGRWFQMKAEDLRLACNAGGGTASGGTTLPAITSKDRVISGDIAFKVIPAATGGAGKSRSAAAATGGKVEITGRGFGHGVGMCQYCAKSMAERGDDWRKMLTLFYPGAELVRAYR